MRLLLLLRRERILRRGKAEDAKRCWFLSFFNERVRCLFSLLLNDADAKSVEEWIGREDEITSCAYFDIGLCESIVRAERALGGDAVCSVGDAEKIGRVKNWSVWEKVSRYGENVSQVGRERRVRPNCFPRHTERRVYRVWCEREQTFRTSFGTGGDV